MAEHQGAAGREAHDSTPAGGGIYARRAKAPLHHCGAGG